MSLKSKLDNMTENYNIIYNEMRNIMFNKIEDYVYNLWLVNNNLHPYNKVKKIYGGQTEEELEIREKQHLNDEPDRFNGMQICHIGFESENHFLIKDGENYLIKCLDKYFGKRCINKRDGYGRVIMTGGRGVKHHKGDVHTLYIMIS